MQRIAVRQGTSPLIPSVTSLYGAVVTLVHDLDALPPKPSPDLRKCCFHSVLCVLDHINNPTMYSSNVAAWAAELSVFGFLAAAPRFIALYLEGRPQDVRSYLTAHRTRFVDVDKRGKPCKERLLSVVAEGSLESISSEFIISLTSSCEWIAQQLDGKPLLDEFRKISGHGVSQSLYKKC